MPRFTVRRLAFAASLLAHSTLPAAAHCFSGNRFFPATLNVDDPCVADELSLPTLSRYKTADDPPAQQLDISAEFSKRLTENFGVSISPTWSRIKQPGSPTVSGLQNLDTNFKYQLLNSARDEFVMSASLAVSWGNTGSTALGGDTYNTYTPTLYLGKGFGNLPNSLALLRPFAVTGQVGYAVPGRFATFGVDADSGDVTKTRNPQELVYGGSLQYSLPYLKSSVQDYGLPNVVNRLIPIIEWQATRNINNLSGPAQTTGTINPGVIWVGNKYQLAVEAIVPMNRASGTGTGAMAQLHLYLDDIFPTTLGEPLFGGSNASPGRPVSGN